MLIRVHPISAIFTPSAALQAWQSGSGLLIRSTGAYQTAVLDASPETRLSKLTPIPTYSSHVLQSAVLKLSPQFFFIFLSSLLVLC